MSKYLIAFALFACGGNKQPAPSEPAPQQSTPEPAAMSPEECTAQGGQVKGDIGDGKVACDAGQRELGRVNQGIEGAICCAAPAS
jgi:hypothetical protein